MKTPIPTLARLLMLLALIMSPRLVRANLAGPYTADANTLYLFHFDETGSVTTNSGSKGGLAYTVANSTSGNGLATPPTVTTMLGGTAYANGAISFGTCITNPTAGYLVGYDANTNGVFEGDVSVTVQSPDRFAMTNLNNGNGGSSPFTFEALIQPTSTAGSQEIICTDNSQGNATRGFQFRISSGTLQLQWIGGAAPTAVSGTIPTTGADAFVPGTWYHVACVYDGTTVTLYWTKMDPANGAAHVVNSGAMTINATRGAVVSPLIIGNEDRNSSQEQFLGSIDEVRISSVARAANQMQFFSPLVTITQSPVSQNVDYNQRVGFSVTASSLSALGYQWRFNSNSIAGSTNSTYVITNVAAGNAGYYDVVVTNASGLSATSSPALLVVGAANFLNHRYSFTTDTSDSIGGATGTNFGNATVSGGQLVLDGSAGTYMQLPGNLYNGGNSTALTFEFWATFGADTANATVFDFGNTNVLAGGSGINYVGFSPHTSGNGQQIDISGGDVSFQQLTMASGTLDGQTVHVACVIDPPNQTMSIYTNGVLEAANTSMTVGIANLNDALSYIGRSLFSTDPYLNGSIDELRIYNGAISALSVKQSDLLGPNQILADGPVKFLAQPTNTTVAVGQTATFSAVAIGYLPITYQWFTNGVPVPGATNAAYTFATVLAQNNLSLSVNATNTIGVTTYVTNSTPATLTVYTPSTLAWVGTSEGGANGSWDTTSLNWTNDGSGGSLVAFVQNDGALLDDRSGGGIVDINQAIIPYNLKVNATDNYILSSSSSSGLLTGQGGLTKLNSGTLIVDVTNLMTGPVLISGGTLQIGNNDGSGTLGNGLVTNNAHLSITRGDTAFNFANAIHGTGSVSFDGFGAVTVSGNSDYTGNTVLNQGIVDLISSSGLGAGGTVVGSGAQLYITANVNVAGSLTINGTGDGNGALRKGGAGFTGYSGPVIMGSDSTIGIDSGATLSLSNSLSGLAALTVAGGGTLALNTPNNYTGGTTISAGIIDINANGTLGAGAVTVNGAGYLLIGNGLNFTNAVFANAAAAGVGLGLLMVNDNTNNIVTSISGPITFNTSTTSGGNFVGPTSSGYLDITGPVTNEVTGQISVRNGFVHFSGGGDYASLILNLGTVSIGANNGVSTNATLTLAATGNSIFDLNGFNQILSGLADGISPILPEMVTNSSAIPSTLTMDVSSGSLFSGVIGGNLALVVNMGSLNLAGTNTYTGNTTVNGGLLELGQPDLAANSTVTVANGATLQLDFTVTNIVNGLVLNGVSKPAGVYNGTTSPSSISGSGSLQVVPVATNPVPIGATVVSGNLQLTWPLNHTGWTLEVQTNSLSTGLGTNWVRVAGSAASNQISIPISSASSSVFYRLIYP